MKAFCLGLSLLGAFFAAAVLLPDGRCRASGEDGDCVGDGEPAVIRVSVTSSGREVAGHSRCPAISADGRFVAFESYAAYLAPGGTTSRPNIFVHDRETGLTERASVSSCGEEADGDCRHPSISADGRFVAFCSRATNLVPGDTNGTWDVFVHNRQTGETERASVDSSGHEADSCSYSPSISADGRLVAFYSHAGNLVPGDGNRTYDVFVHDREIGRTERMSVSSSGDEGYHPSQTASISADGRLVAFGSGAANLAPGGANRACDVFVRDREADVTERASVSPSDARANAFNGEPSISADGRLVAFLSDAPDLVPGDANGERDVFVCDRRTGSTEMVSVSSSGDQGDGRSSFASISGDGRFVAFHSNAANLVPCDGNGTYDVFVHDRETGRTARVSESSSGAEADGISGSPAISADGRSVAFGSAAANLVPGDTNGRCDVFVARNPLAPQPSNEPRRVERRKECARPRF